MTRIPLIVSTAFLAFGLGAAVAKAEPFRPEAGKFPPLEKAYAYRGELVFVDHPNRRGSIRVQGEGTYFRNAPHPFAMLPYGFVRYHAAPADLRDVPLETVMHVLAYLPPDPAASAVPVLPVDNRDKTAGYSGKGIAPAENHVALLEDEPSFCLRQGLVWKLKEVEVKGREGLVTASRGPRQGGEDKAVEEKLTFDAATRIWRGREVLGIDELISQGTWPADGKKTLSDFNVLLGISWQPTPDGVFTRFHISDIWLDETSMERATRNQAERHKAFIRKRWMPAWVDDVEYGKFGRATVTATLFGGMDPELYADFQTGVQAVMNGVESTLKHAGGGYGPAHMASKGAVVDVKKATGEAPFLSSGLQIRFETDLVIEGIRKGRIVRIRPSGWPAVNLPREEYIGDGNSPEDRFPTPAIFPKY
jgi:hypothetical protein